MQTLIDRCDRAAGLLLYPGTAYHEQVRRCQAELATALGADSDFLAEFAEAIHPLTPEELEELFTRTFDLNPTCALEVGWHLYGENYSRGDFLVKMRQALRRHGLPESAELPDHLSHVLSVLGRLPPAEYAPFAESHVVPAIDKMLAGLAGQGNPYEKLLRAIRRLVAHHLATLPLEVGHG